MRIQEKGGCVAFAITIAFPGWRMTAFLLLALDRHKPRPNGRGVFLIEMTVGSE